MINTILSFFQNLSYIDIIALMTIESSFIPFPSEIVIPPAAFMASQGEMNIFLVILAGIFGSLIGATINYYLAFYFGRAVIYKIADSKIFALLLINSKKIEKAEKFFLKYGNISTFIGRLIIAVRQLISIPAGFSKMNFKSFIFYTSLGSGLWVIILAILGYVFGANKEVLINNYKILSLGIIGIALLVIILLIIYKKFKIIKN